MASTMTRRHREDVQHAGSPLAIMVDSSSDHARDTHKLPIWVLDLEQITPTCRRPFNALADLPPESKLIYGEALQQMLTDGRHVLILLLLLAPVTVAAIDKLQISICYPVLLTIVTKKKKKLTCKHMRD
uniref:Uncharacterized protein n=1 Tax=Oryza punctata TaxID=4537 RepID=A0A0E0JV85_ORYPU